MALYIGGKNSVKERLLSKRPIKKLMLIKSSDEKTKELIRLATEQGISIKYADKEELNELINIRHQGVVALIPDYSYANLEDIFAFAQKRREKPLVLVLANLQDPHNLGAIIRSAECAGVHGIIIPKDRSVAVNETVMKVAAGAVEYMKLVQVTNLNQTIKKLKDKGLWVIGMEMDGDKKYWEEDLTDSIAIVMGGEEKGIPELVRKNCDFLVSIPLKGQVESLNVSAAASVILFESVKQRFVSR